MKTNYLLLMFLFCLVFRAQQNLCDFESNKFINFGLFKGELDSLSLNDFPSVINQSAYCAKYIRDTTFYDFIRIYPTIKLADVTPYLSNAFSAPKIKMKVFSKAPIGTLINLQLGISSVDNYPDGVNSEFIAATTQQNSWEILNFNYYQSPIGSLASSQGIDKIVLLFNPGSTVQDTFYFDDVIGPDVLFTSKNNYQENVSENYFLVTPNPSNQKMFFDLNLREAENISIKLYDLAGNISFLFKDLKLDVGKHKLQFETDKLPSGIYFCEFKSDSFRKIKKIIINH